MGNENFQVEDWGVGNVLDEEFYDEVGAEALDFWVYLDFGGRRAGSVFLWGFAFKGSPLKQCHISLK